MATTPSLSAKPSPNAGARPRTDQSNPAGRLRGMLISRRWEIALLALIAVVAIQVGALDWYTSYPAFDGSGDKLPNTFASIDHPFHINKEQAVLNALRDGQFPGWISNHQGGYPTEFYPLGADLVVATGWAFSLGQLPLEIVHKLVVIAVLFIPVLAYWAIARRDRLPLGIAVTAGLLHVFLPGNWLGGGPDELLRMGMWPNVFATYLTLPLILWAAGYLRHGSRRSFVLAAVVASLAIYSNPRSTIAVATALLAVGIVALLERRESCPRQSRTRQKWRTDIASIRPLVRRSVLLALTIGLLCSALLVPLRAHQHLYEFSHFVEFDHPGQIWSYYRQAVPTEIIVLALLGMVIGLARRDFYTRVLAVWLPLSYTVILIAGWLLRDLSIFAQLEGPRLIPLLRLPSVFLAAVALREVVRFVIRLLRADRLLPATNIAAVTIVALAVLTPVSMLEDDQRGLPDLETTDQPDFAAIARSARIYQQATTPDDRPFVIGSTISEHAAFWIPVLTGDDAFLSNWVWNWRIPDYANRTQIADVASALRLDFLRRHALTMVLISTDSDATLNVARASPYLDELDPGTAGGYAIFRVDDPGPKTRGPVTAGAGTVTALDQSREHLRATIETTQPTEVTIAINAFPAWHATVNGQATRLNRTADGSMHLTVPAGTSALELRYTTEPAVWAGRILVTLGILLMIAVVLAPRLPKPPRLASRVSRHNP
ncbi:MAG TPA: hypothetical protein VFV93_14015 [Thermomicrobiales bacterium]|nr:hypothetical protein [Thermomicrobiales bacterium]